MYSPRSSGRGNTLFILNLVQLLDDYTILLDQYVNKIQLAITERLKVIIAMGLTSSLPEQRS